MTSSGPLAGVRVVDFTVALSGPFATMLMADQGADVIKVESSAHPDVARMVGAKRNGVGAVYHSTNRGKRSLSINITHPAAAPVVARLASWADVVAQNWRPGVADRLGIGYSALTPHNPDLIYLSIAGLGTEGPLAGYRVWDNIVQAVSGMAGVQGGAGDPAYVRQLICDKVTALTAFQAVTAALYAREKGEGGQHINLSMLDASVAFLWPDLASDVALIGEERNPPPPRNYGIVAHTDGSTTSAPITDEEFRGWCRALGAPEVADDPRFATHADRLNHPEFEATRQQVQAHAASLTVAEALARLQAEGVEAVEVSTPRHLIHHPQLQANNTIQNQDHRLVGPIREVRPPTRFSATPTTDNNPPAPLLGEHTQEILTALGFSPPQISTLQTSGALT